MARSAVVPDEGAPLQVARLYRCFAVYCLIGQYCRPRASRVSVLDAGLRWTRWRCRLHRIGTHGATTSVRLAEPTIIGPGDLVRLADRGDSALVLRLLERRSVCRRKNAREDRARCLWVCRES